MSLLVTKYKITTKIKKQASSKPRKKTSIAKETPEVKSIEIPIKEEIKEPEIKPIQEQPIFQPQHQQFKPFQHHKHNIFHREKPHHQQNGFNNRPILITDKEKYKTPDFKKFRSDGEKLIAEFLSTEKIHFVHEYPIALRDEQNQIRLWYPDFFLPKLSIVIEYLGMKGREEYERAVRRKTKLFKELKVDFIYITPNRFTKPDWKHYIIRSNWGFVFHL